MNHEIPSSSKELLGENLSIAQMRKILDVKIAVQTAINRLAFGKISKVTPYGNTYQTSELTRAALRKILTTERKPEIDMIEKIGKPAYEQSLETKSIETGLDRGLYKGLARNKMGHTVKKQ